MRRPLAGDRQWRECARCRHPMTRRADLAGLPERPWLVWDPERWRLPVPWPGVLLVGGLLLLVPRAADLLLRGRSHGLLTAAVFVAGFVWAAVSAWVSWKWRQHRRRPRTGQERGDDWMCAACLHAETAT